MRVLVSDQMPEGMEWLRERLLAQSAVVTVNGCWNWTGSTHPRGYGRITTPWAKPEKAHRAAWIAFHGPIPAGMVVCHRCDNPRCVNPEHLWLGTQRDNIADMNAKGRQRPSPGERNGQAKLTEEDVREIRASTETNIALGKRFGVSDALISYVRRGKAWGQVK